MLVVDEEDLGSAWESKLSDALLGQGDNATVHSVSVHGKEFALKCRTKEMPLKEMICKLKTQMEIQHIDGVIVDEGVMRRSDGEIDRRLTLQMRVPHDAKPLADMQDVVEQERVKDAARKIMEKVHGKNVVHRDLSHYNIMAMPGSIPSEVWIIDWDDAQGERCDAGPNAEKPRQQSKKHAKPNLYS